MPASRHDVPDLPFVRRAPARAGHPAGSAPPAVRPPGDGTRILRICTASGRGRG
ncbi:hypothetical protein [Streptomyces sp. NPDC057682]|uniref:hypothetical protein n=1 Tax=unclassified Streptomyces TaxID=2593676 RepID=UPI00365CF2CC